MPQKSAANPAKTSQVPIKRRNRQNEVLLHISDYATYRDLAGFRDSIAASIQRFFRMRSNNGR